tara:strand:- start:3537 stop:3650 length:114 start_codon:yes stop_codon:yes gene_type:complete
MLVLQDLSFFFSFEKFMKDVVVKLKSNSVSESRGLFF